MRPIWKWTIGITVAVLVAVMGAVWYLGNNWKPLLEAKLQEVIRESTDGLYTLKYDKIDINAALGNVTLTKAELLPDSLVYRQLVEAKKAPNNRFHVALDELKIRRFSIWDVLVNEKLDIKTIELHTPAVHMMYEYHSFNDTIPQDKESKSLYDQIKGTFSSVSVDKIDLKNVGFKYTKHEEGKSSEINLDSLQVKIRHVLINEDSAADTARIFFAKALDVLVPNFEYDLGDGFYRARFDGLRFNTEARELAISKLSFAPKMSKTNFFKKKNQAVTMAILKVDSLKFDGLDFHQLVEQQKIVSKSLLVKDGRVDLFNDLRYPKRKRSHIGRAPHQQLMKLKIPVDIDTVFVDNVDILYGETSSKTYQEGIITFNGARGVITNVTNDSTVLAQDKFMRADLRCRIMNAGNLHAMFGFDMLSANGAYTYKGSLGSMQATAYNKILKPLLNVEIGSGNVRKVTFDMHGTDRRNWGDFRFDYDNLRVRILGEKDEEGKRSKKRVLSFLVNQVIINDSNPDANEKYHIGKITYQRVPEFSFWKTLWRSLLEGIKQTAGISPEREARLMGTAKGAQTTVKQTKNVAQKTGSFIKGLFKKKDKQENEERENKK